MAPIFVQAPRRVIHLRDLLRGLVAREVKLRYRGSLLGMAWSLLTPLAQMAIFTFLFTRVLPLDIPNYAVYVFSGVLAWSWFQSSMYLACTAISDNRELIRRPGFPTVVLPAVTVTTNLIHYLLALPVLFAFLALGGGVPLTAVALPLVMLLQFAFTLGLAYLIAACHVAFRDTQHILSVVLILSFYVTPVFYRADVVPAQYQGWYQLNPMLHLLDAYRSLLIYGEWPALRPLLLISIAAAALMLAGATIFMRASHRFAEEL